MPGVGENPLILNINSSDRLTSKDDPNQLREFKLGDIILTEQDIIKIFKFMGYPGTKTLGSRYPVTEEVANLGIEIISDMILTDDKLMDAAVETIFTTYGAARAIKMVRSGKPKPPKPPLPEEVERKLHGLPERIRAEIDRDFKGISPITRFGKRYKYKSAYEDAVQTSQ